MAKANTNEKVETPATDSETPAKKRTRTAMPFGRSFGVTVKFHNDMTQNARDAITAGILGVIEGTADNETLDVHRSTRGEPNPNLQTWLVAPFGYDWPEGDNKERGIRIASGPLAEALRKYAKEHDVSIDEAAAAMAAAFGLNASDLTSESETADESAS